MLARLQQATTLGLLLAAALWAAWFASRGAPGWALGGALLILFGYTLFLAAEFVLVRCVHGDDPAPRATWPQLLRAWWAEAVIDAQVFCWRQPFRSRRFDDWLPEAASPQAPRGVVLVHGFVCNRGVWNPWMPRLRALGVPYVAPNLEPVFASIDAYPPLIEAAVRRVEAATRRPPVIVAHSMGGLAVRAWLARYGAAGRVHHVVTIGTPHRGTWLGRFGFSRNASEMRLDSPWQQRLAAHAQRASALDPRRMTCFHSHCDNVVFPASRATLPGADNRHVAGSAHLQLAYRPEVFAEVLRIAREPAEAG